jgi:hypothetical protein
MILGMIGKWKRAEDPWHGSPTGAAALVDLISDESDSATIALINMINKGPREG